MNAQRAISNINDGRWGGGGAQVMFYNLVIRQRDKEGGWAEIMPNLLFMVGLGVGNQ